LPDKTCSPMAILKEWIGLDKKLSLVSPCLRSGNKGRLLLFNTVNYSFFGGRYNCVDGKSLC